MSSREDKTAERRTLLLTVLDTVKLVHARPVVGRVAAERDLERGEELVHTGEQRLRPVRYLRSAWTTYAVGM